MLLVVGPEEAAHQKLGSLEEDQVVISDLCFQMAVESKAVAPEAAAVDIHIEVVVRFLGGFAGRIEVVEHTGLECFHTEPVVGVAVDTDIAGFDKAAEVEAVPCAQPPL